MNWDEAETVPELLVDPFYGVAVQARKMAAWDERTEVARAKRLAVTDKDGQIVDYRDVTISGYLSTFKNFTPRDRDGDYVEPSAFDGTIAKFSNNPVMLMDHKNEIPFIAGSFKNIRKDRDGLAVVGHISNAPDDMMKRVRFLVAEGHLKTLSMGGLFLYGHDGKAINEVDLWEGSLVPVPANQDARFSVRSFDPVVSAKALSRHMASTKEVRGV